MPMERFSPAWAESWKQALNDSSSYRFTARKWKGPLVLRVLGSVNWWLDLEAGQCNGVRSVSGEEAGQAETVLAASASDWNRVLDGELAPLVAIMQGVIKLEKGSMIRLSRFSKAASDMMDLAMRLEAPAPAAGPDPRFAPQPLPDPVVHTSFRTTSAGLDQDSLPMQLYHKAKKLGVWDPMDIDLRADRADWVRLAPDEQDVLMRLLAMFQAGEEAVTLDLLPLIRVVAREGRIEEEMYLTTFLFEEAKHTELFRRVFDEVVMRRDDLSGYHTPSYRNLFYEALPTALSRLDTDASPAAQLQASATYNMVVEGTLAETGYHAFYSVLESRGIMPGVTEGIRLLQRDESRHIAYGIHLITRLVRANPSLMGVLQSTMTDLLPVASATISELFAHYDPMPFGLKEEDFLQYAMDQFGKRMRRIELATTLDQSVAE
ncbi:MAG: R2-like ligand-binding oxidase [Bacteroidetes bacterium]|nr:R2-like ligand-binding oxidase [Bacteroidota bacterium]